MHELKSNLSTKTTKCQKRNKTGTKRFLRNEKIQVPYESSKYVSIHKSVPQRQAQNDEAPLRQSQYAPRSRNSAKLVETASRNTVPS